jgi:hypothetical protein
MIVSALLVLFVVLLAVWVGNPNSGHNKPEVQATFSPTPTPSFPTDSAVLPTPSPTPTPTPSGTGTVGVKLPPVTGVQVYGAGTHLVVLTVTSNSTLAAVGYEFRNGKNGGTKRVGSKSYTISEEVEGGAPLAIVAGQVAYYGTEATCTITVDGTLRTTRTSHGAYSVVVCTA